MHQPLLLAWEPSPYLGICPLPMPWGRVWVDFLLAQKRAPLLLPRPTLCPLPPPLPPPRQ